MRIDFDKNFLMLATVNILSRKEVRLTSQPLIMSAHAHYYSTSTSSLQPHGIYQLYTIPEKELVRKLFRAPFSRRCYQITLTSLLTKTDQRPLKS